MELQIDKSDLKELGDTGEYVPAIGLGTWDIRDYRRAEKALIEAVNQGLNLIDTAEMYHSGRAEELVGRVAREMGRENMFIVTKLMPDKFTEPYLAEKAMRNSLKRLDTSYVDLVLIHWPNTAIPISRQITILEMLAEKGYTRYIGVSNFDKTQVMQALDSLKKHKIVANQVKYSVLDRYVEREILPTCIENKITIQAYTPIEKGGVLRIRKLIELSKKYGKTPVQIALNYLISRPRVTAIPKTEKVERVIEFKGSLGWRLDPSDIKALEEL